MCTKRFLVQHDSCECECGLNKTVFNSKQKWNLDECHCVCKELADWSSCKDDYISNPSTCDCECNKACKIDKYLDARNRSRKNHWFYKLALRCADVILNTTKTSFHGNVKFS